MNYNGDMYHLIAKNCNHFCKDACYKLTGNSIPKWVNRLAGIGKPIFKVAIVWTAVCEQNGLIYQLKTQILTRILLIVLQVLSAVVFYLRLFKLLLLIMKLITQPMKVKGGS